MHEDTSYNVWVLKYLVTSIEVNILAQLVFEVDAQLATSKQGLHTG